MRTIHLRSALLITLAFVCWPISATAITLTWLGDLPGGFDQSFAFGISADGSTVIGRSYSGDENELVAFVWNSATGMQGLDDQVEDGLSSSAEGVSADGSVVVGMRLPMGSASMGVVWDPINGLQDIGDLPGGSASTSAAEVSDDGSTVAGSGNSASGEEAFIWDPLNGLLGLGDLPGGSFNSYANGISADGSVVVGTGSSASGFQAFVWDGFNGMRSLSDLVGTSLPYSYARDVSADGSFVVGGLWTGTETQAFRWDAVEGLLTLGIPTGNFLQTWARDVSDDGAVIVGTADGPSGSGDGFVWNESIGIVSLESLLISNGIDLTGIDLRHATGISADGTKIVGIGRSPSRSNEAFLIDLPEPAVAGMIGVGALALVGGLGRGRSRTI